MFGMVEAFDDWRDRFQGLDVECRADFIADVQVCEAFLELGDSPKVPGWVDLKLAEAARSDVWRLRLEGKGRRDLGVPAEAEDCG